MTAETTLVHQDVLGRPSQLSPLSSPAASSSTIMPDAAGGDRDGGTTALTATGAAVGSSPANAGHHRFVKRYRTELAASSSSVFSTLAAFPLDSVKTRMQTYHYKGFLDCVRLTYQTEKLGGFFRGMPRLVSFCFVRMVAN